MHPKTPDHPRFTAYTFYINGKWMYIQLLKGTEREECVNAARCAWLEVALQTEDIVIFEQALNYAIQWKDYFNICVMIEERRKEVDPEKRRVLKNIIFKLAYGGRYDYHES